MRKMKGTQKMLALTVAMAMMVATGAVFADALKSPLDIASQLTGKSTEVLLQERATGKTYGTMAKDAGKLEEFQKEMLLQKKAILDQRVKSGTLTQAQADQIYKAIQENQVNCNGSGQAKIGQKYGAGFGKGQGKGQGQGNNGGKGFGMGMNGNGSCGNCTVQ